MSLLLLSSYLAKETSKRQSIQLFRTPPTALESVALAEYVVVETA